jgi:hypothetical protein
MLTMLLWIDDDELLLAVLWGAEFSNILVPSTFLPFLHLAFDLETSKIERISRKF